MAKRKEVVKDSKSKHPGGRPTKYSVELAAKICHAIATNAKSIYTLCHERDDFPVTSTVFDWMNKYPEFSDEYFKAKERQGLTVTEDLWLQAEKLTSKEECDIYDRKFRFHQWHLSKLAPKRFNDKRDKDEDKADETISNLSATVKELAKKHEKDY